MRSARTYAYGAYYACVAGSSITGGAMTGVSRIKKNEEHRIPTTTIDLSFDVFMGCVSGGVIGLFSPVTFPALGIAEVYRRVNSVKQKA